MQRKITLSLATLMLMFPQVVETIYSPALTRIATGFHVSAEVAAQTLSCYFFAFSIGVVVWGRLCDVVGRRPAILAGLALYALASVIALLCDNFSTLLAVRMLAAFGAAVGSVGIQTALRDGYSGPELTRLFSIMGVAMAISPAVGVLSGTLLVHYWGYQGVFAGLTLLAALLLVYAMWQLPETRPRQVTQVPFFRTLWRMTKDDDVWCSASLVALFNICMFGYYQLAPFYFEILDIPEKWFGYTGVVLSTGVGLGAVVNQYLVGRSWQFPPLLAIATGLVLTGGLSVHLLKGTVWFVLPMLLVVMAYGIAIPNTLARALRHYKECVGTAGAILGLMYYSMLGFGLVLAGLMQRLDIVLIASGLLLLLLTWRVTSRYRVSAP